MSGDRFLAFRLICVFRLPCVVVNAALMETSRQDKGIYVARINFNRLPCAIFNRPNLLFRVILVRVDRVVYAFYFPFCALNVKVLLNRHVARFHKRKSSIIIIVVATLRNGNGRTWHRWWRMLFRFRDRFIFLRCRCRIYSFYVTGVGPGSKGGLRRCSCFTRGDCLYTAGDIRGGESAWWRGKGRVRACRHSLNVTMYRQPNSCQAPNEHLYSYQRLYPLPTARGKEYGLRQQLQQAQDTRRRPHRRKERRPTEHNKPLSCTCGRIFQEIQHFLQHMRPCCFGSTSQRNFQLLPRTMQWKEVRQGSRRTMLQQEDRSLPYQPLRRQQIPPLPYQEHLQQPVQRIQRRPRPRKPSWSRRYRRQRPTHST